MPYRAAMGGYVALWAKAFAATLCAELLVSWFLLRVAEPSRGRRVGAIALVNVASHPAVWFVFPELGFGYGVAVALSEAWAVALEGLGYRLIFPSLTWRRAFLTSLLANAASVAFGLALRAAGVRI